MREILFRGKRVNNGEWVEGLLGCAYSRPNEKYYFIHNCETDDTEYEVVPETVGQFTGLTDKNGKKIFEGDIVKIYWKDNVLTMGDIRYDVNMCRFIIAEDFTYPYAFDNTTQFEVIGNVFDNFELLEVRK